ncbi:tetratricopeptide (TPR) repeat protein [Deinococcus metalli]|nr:tetratricopeptide (TPR) repeat protein [Deinococcus metalli]
MTALSAVLALSVTAAAQSQPAAQALLDQGKWQEAASAGAALNTSAGLTLAAEATTAGASLVPDNQKKALFQKAQDYASAAIAKDRSNADAYFELARAQGRLAQFVGVFQSLGLAKDVKANLDKALELNPKMAGGYVALGLWNATLDSGGLKGAIAVQATGASRSNVAPNFEKAISLEPNTPIHRIEYANALLLQGKKAEAAAQLDKAVAMPAVTFWEKRDLEQAKATLAKLR